MQKEYQYCLRCGRVLKKPENKLKGYGDICFKKLNISNKNKLFSITPDKNNEL